MIKQNYKLKKILSDEIVFLDQENRKISVSFEHGNIHSLEVLEDILNQYSGGLIVVSHDKEFLENLNLDQVINLDEFSF